MEQLVDGGLRIASASGPAAGALPRSFLPRLDAQRACALGQRLISAAAGRHHRLPRGVGSALERLRLRHATLSDLAGETLPSPADNGAEDNAVAALHEWLNGWARLPTPEGQVAQKILLRLFGQQEAGALRRRLGWADVELRLRWIREEGHERMIDQLGGARLLRHLREAHVELERALGAAAQEEAAGADQGRALESFLDACQTYVLRLAALEDPDDEDATELARALLRPLTDWDC